MRRRSEEVKRSRPAWPAVDFSQSSEHEGYEHIVQLLQKLRLHWLIRRFPPRVIQALYVLVNGFLTIGILALLAFVTRNPFVFPSVGPTAYLLFFSPLVDASSPRNAILGHAIGLVCGYAALHLTGASVSGGIASTVGMHPGIYWPRILAAAISLSVTGALMVLFRVSHPPAGATTLIVSLGIISQPLHLVTIEVAVFLLVLQAFLINRLAGIPYPMWAPNKDDHLRQRISRG